MDTAIRKRSDLTPAELRDIAARIQVYDYDGIHVRAIRDGDSIWLVLVDVLHALCYTVKPSHIAKRLRNGEVELKEIGAKNAMVNCINRAGLYSFALYANDTRVLDFYSWAKRAIWEM